MEECSNSEVGVGPSGLWITTAIHNKQIILSSSSVTKKLFPTHKFSIIYYISQLQCSRPTIFSNTCSKIPFKSRSHKMYYELMESLASASFLHQQQYQSLDTKRLVTTNHIMLKSITRNSRSF